MFPTINKKETGVNLRRIMDMRGVKPKDIQEYLGFGCVQSVYRWLDGVSMPTVDNLYAISKMLQVPILDKISEVANAGKMDEVAKMIPKAKYDTPKPKEVTQNNQTINVTQDINVNFPNVTNTTGAEYLVKALRKAGADVLVYNK